MPICGHVKMPPLAEEEQEEEEEEEEEKEEDQEEHAQTDPEGKSGRAQGKAKLYTR